MPARVSKADLGPFVTRHGTGHQPDLMLDLDPDRWHLVVGGTTVLDADEMRPGWDEEDLEAGFHSLRLHRVLCLRLLTALTIERSVFNEACNEHIDAL